MRTPKIAKRLNERFSQNASVNRMKLRLHDCLCPKKLVPSLLTLLMFCMGVLVVATTNGTVVMNKPRLSSLLQLLRFKRLFDEGDQSDQFPHMERPLAVMFTTFSNRTDKVFIYTNTIKNWATFLPHIQPVLFTTFPSGPAVDAARANGWYVYPCPAVNEFNSPVMQAMYLKSYELFNASMYGFANGDIMFDWGLNDTIKKVTEHFDTFGHTLLFGLRYNFNVTEPEDYVDDPLWPQAKANELANSSKSILFRPQFGDAHDYFFISKDYPLNKTASVVVSREGFDTYLVSISNQMLLSTIDGTYTISAVHQTDKDGTMAHQLISNESDALYNRIMLGKEFRYGYGFSTNALHKTARRDGKIVIECNKKRKLRTGPCKTDQDLY